MKLGRYIRPGEKFVISWGVEMGVAKRLYSAPWKMGNGKPNGKPNIKVYRRPTKPGTHIYIIETYKKVS